MAFFPYGIDLEDFAPPSTDEQVRVRYCIACSCAQRTIAREPCWNCGGDTQGERPSYWPPANTGVRVENGDVFSPSELLEPEREGPEREVA